MQYAIILAGGAGRRLWPASTPECPKQFIDFLGSGRSLLQQTYDRFSRFLPADRIFVSTFEPYIPLVAQQLPALPEENILGEPVQLSTLAGAARAARAIGLADPSAAIACSPCDHFIHDPAAFAREVTEGLEYVAKRLGVFLSLGIVPTNANTAYGYIQKGEAVGAEGEADVFRVKSFSEKPDAALARFFCDTGEFLWNAGLFLFSAQTFLSLLAQFSRVQGERLAARAFFQGDGWREEAEGLSWHNAAFDGETFRQMCYGGEMPRNLDLLIFETCADVRVRACTFGWDDVGTWSAIYDVASKDEHGNFILPRDAEVSCTDTHGNLVRLPKGKRLVCSSLHDYVIVDTPETLLIVPSTDPSHIRGVIMGALSAVNGI